MSILVKQCYRAIAAEYGDKCAARTGVPLINHIDEGLVILESIGASEDAKAAYCLHPLYQDDGLLLKASAMRFPSNLVLLAMEYRNKANAFLCTPANDIVEVKDMPKMVLKDVADMLIADKVQNRKDFEIYHLGSHPRSKQLHRYFKMWCEHLSVDKTEYEKLRELIS